LSRYLHASPIVPYWKASGSDAASATVSSESGAYSNTAKYQSLGVDSAYAGDST
jgi:hypothetical protein